MHLKIECLSDTCFAQPSPTEGVVDIDLARDVYGLPLPSGKTLHGLLRDTWQIARPAWPALDPQGVGEGLLGKTHSHAPSGALCVGDASLSPATRAWVAWARDGRGRASNDQKLPASAVSEAFLAERNLTAEDRSLGIPRAETLRRIRVIPRGTILTAPLTRLGPSFSPAQRNFLNTLFDLTRHAGLHRNRGLGHVRLSIVWEEDDAPAPPAGITEIRPDGRTLFLPISMTLTAPCLIAHRELDENSVTTKPYLPGASLRGALAAAMERQGMTPDDLADLIAGGRVRFLNAYPVAGDNNARRALPTPITWRRDKSPLLDDHEAGPQDEVLALLGPDERDEDEEGAQQRQPVGTLFYAPAPGGRHTPAETTTRARTHQSRDSATGTTSTGGNDNVFVYEALEAGETFQGYIALTESKDWEPIHNALFREPLLLGRSGRAGYGGLPVCKVLSPEGVPRESGGLNGTILAGRRFTVRLTSDAVLRDPATGQHDPHGLREALARHFRNLAEVIGAAVAPTSAQGYSRLWRTELPTVPAAAMGSVALLEAKCSIPPDEVDRLQSEPLGERTPDGYGCFIIEPIPTDSEDKVGELFLNAAPAPAPAPQPPGPEPPELVEAQKRLFALCLRCLLAESALLASAEARNMPPPSLLGRLRVPLRDTSAWRQTWRDWLEGENSLRGDAMGKITGCSFGDASLATWMHQVAQDGDAWLPLLGDESKERERHQIVSRERAETIWNEIKRGDAMRLHYAASALAHLARRATGREDA